MATSVITKSASSVDSSWSVVSSQLAACCSQVRDPTGDGHVLPGFGDQREVELLVDSGFTPVEAIKIATLNGATYLGQADHIGSIAVGKNADLVVVKGDPSTHINDIENVELVFRDGLGFNSARLLESVKGRFGLY
jgi:hypothetical protein